MSGIHPPQGAVRTSWVGNSFGGNGGENGFGYWVQDGADEIEVMPDGTVLAGVEWDEAGRCVGLYKDGKPNRVLVKGRPDGPETAWGWNTGNNALAVWKDQIFDANTGKRLIRFRWTPGDLDSVKYAEEVETKEKAVGLAARGDRLAVVYPGEIELRRMSDLGITGSFAVPDAKDAAFAPDGSLWVLAGDAVRHYTAEGKETGDAVPGLQKPRALSFDPKGRLLICDNGPRQQVLFYDVSQKPQLLKTFGEEGGLLSGAPGRAAPNKLFALCGAGVDEAGNLYIAMSFGNGPNGNLFLRSFSPQGQLRWELMNASFVDTFGFDPSADGTVVYSRTAVFNLSLSQTRPGSEQKLRAVTLDPLQAADDRAKFGCTALLRHLQGRDLLYTIGQYAGGYRLYTFDKGRIAHPVDKIGESEQWAWDVDSGGDIWHGDAPGKTIRRYPFFGWSAEGRPRYDWQHPQIWPWPEGWALIRRILYDPATDTLYLAGYLEGERVETWGVVGATIRRYDGWRKGPTKLRWTVATPRDGNTDAKEGPLTPSSVSLAGGYLFFGMVKPTNGKQYVHIYRTSDGGYAGSFEPDPAAVGGAGWLDMPYSTQAFRRKNGEYLVLAEEDWRGKNLLYRWTPVAK
jgi:hypothetical protein